MKSDILSGDLECENLVAVSVHDTKTVYCFTTAITCLKFVEKERLVYSKDLGECLISSSCASTSMTITTQGLDMLMLQIFSAHTIYLIDSRGRGIGGRPYLFGPSMFFLSIFILLTKFSWIMRMSQK